MAERTLIVRVIGDDRSLQTALARDAKAVKGFEATSTRSLGKVDSAFSKAQRLAAGGFLGGVAFTAALSGLKQVVGAAQESEESLGQTRVALEATGKSWDQYGNQIENAITQQSKLGFDDEALLRTFSLFVRQTDDVGQALRENNIAMDVARARFIDLEQAAQIVNKAALGNAGALRRLGIDTKGATDGMELLALLEQQFGDSAENASTRSTAALDRLHVSLENIEETLGGALLPSIANVADGLAGAADDADLFAKKLQKLGQIRIPEIHIPLVADFGGGTIGGAVSKIAGKGIETAVKVQFLGIGGTVASVIKDAFTSGVEKGLDEPSPGLKSRVDEGFDRFAKKTVSPSGNAILDALDKATSVAKEQVDAALKAGKAAQARDAAADAAEKAAKAKSDAFSKLIAALELGVDKAGLTSRLDDDLAALAALKAGLQKQIKAGEDVANAQSRLVSVEKEIADTTAERARNQKQFAQAQEQARQFRALGLDAQGGKAPPTIQNLKKQLAQLSSRDDLTGSQKGLLDRVRKVLVDPLRKATPETRSAIKELFDTIRSGFKDGEKKLEPITKGSGLNTKKILSGLGLDPDQVRALRGRLSGVSLAGVALASPKVPTGSFAGGGPIVVESHTNLYMDGEPVARTVTRNQQVTRRRNPPQKRGPNRSGI